VIFIAIFSTTLYGAISRSNRSIITIAGSSIRRSMGRITITSTTIGRTICVYVIVGNTVLALVVLCIYTGLLIAAILIFTMLATIILNFAVWTFAGKGIWRSVHDNTMTITTIKITIVELRDTSRRRNRLKTNLI